MLVFWRGIVLLFMWLHNDVIAKDYLALRVINYDDSRLGEKLLPGSRNYLDIFGHIGKLRCATLCTINPKCMSFNVYRGHCELNSIDAYSMNATFEKDRSSEYVGMTRERSPICFEQWKRREITDDDEPNFCKINLKRQDSFWSDWNTTDVTINDATEWQKVSLRFCSSVWSHGGYNTCSGNSVRILEWYRWILEFRDWYDSKKHCRNIGGRLFDDVDGSTSQLDFFYDHLLNTGFWLGITTDDLITWKNLDDDVIPNAKLAWGGIEPVDNGYEYMVGAFASFGQRHYLASMNPEWSAFSVCDMRQT